MPTEHVGQAPPGAQASRLHAPGVSPGAPGPLASIRVLDLTDELGAYCPKLLADLGADVIKIEPPGGAPGRSRGPFANDKPGKDRSLWWAFYNTNKRSVTLDLTSPTGQAALKRLTETADVLVEDRTPGVMASLGLGYDGLRTLNAGLVYTSISPYGQDGPRASWKASDLVGQAMGDLMFRIGWPEDPPNSFGASPAYSQAGAHGAAGTLMALYARQTSGHGQHVDVSMQEAVSIINYDGTPRWALERKAVKRAGPGQGSTGIISKRMWPCKEGQIRFQLVGSQAAAEWPRLIAWLDASEMAGTLGDARWDDMFERVAHLTELEDAIAPFFLTMTAREAQEQGQGRRIMVMAFNRIDDLFTDPQLVSQGFFQQLDHPATGQKITFPGAPYRLSKTPWSLRTPAPSLGQHNALLNESGAEQPTPGAQASRLHALGVSPGASRRPLPLSGVRVLDFTWVVAGPTLTKWLAAYGAQVIKVEAARGAADVVRTDGGASSKGKVGPNVSGTFGNLNTDKLAIALNMNDEGGRAIARRLVAISDVVIENFTPGVMPRWGFGYDDLQKMNPSVIAVSMPGLGSTGPHAHYRGLGSYFMVRTGFDDLVGYPHRETVDLGFAFPDASCNPAHACVAILAALHHRSQTGEGQRIELRQFESTVNYLNTALLDYSVNKRVQTRTGSRHPTAAPHGVYRCAPSPAHPEPPLGHPEPVEGWAAITVFTEEEWLGLCKATGVDPKDPRFATLAARKQNEDALDAELTAWTSCRTATEVMEILQQRGVPAGAIQHAGDLIDTDPQMAHRGFYNTVEHAEMGQMLVEGVPFRLMSPPAFPRKPAPLLGEHNDLVLQQVLGMTEAEVNAAIVAGAVM